MPGEFPAEVEQFILQHIESLAQLEALLLVRGDRDRYFSADEVAKALYTSADLCTGLLNDLQRRGFVEATEGVDIRYRYRPVDQEVDKVIEELATIYQQRRVAVITMIYSKPVSKVQTFADAFRLRKDK